MADLSHLPLVKTDLQFVCINPQWGGGGSPRQKPHAVPFMHVSLNYKHEAKISNGKNRGCSAGVNVLTRAEVAQ